MTVPAQGELLEEVHNVYHFLMKLDMTSDQVFELYNTFSDNLKLKISLGINATTRYDILNDLSECIVNKSWPKNDITKQELKDFQQELKTKCKDFGYTYIE